MSLMRRAILMASQNQWMRQHAPRYGFMRRTVARFMPGEDVQDALTAARTLAANNIHSVLTHLGENIADRVEAEEVTRHYLNVNDRCALRILQRNFPSSLTQLGLDLDAKFCYENLLTLIENTLPVKLCGSTWNKVRMWTSTLELFRRARPEHANVGVCLQAYLYRTEKDLDTLIPMGAAIRLVKGAYNEPAEIAFP